MDLTKNCSVGSEPQRIFRPLIPIVLAIVIGIAAGTWWPGQFWTVLAAALSTAFWLCFLILRHRWASGPPLLLCLLCGYLSIQPWLAPALPDQHVAHFVDKGYWKVHGKVADTPQVMRGRWRFELAAQRLVNQHTTHDVRGRIWVTGRGDWPGAKLGDAVVFRGRLRSIRNFANPGGFDYRRSMMLRGIHARIYATARSLTIEKASASLGARQYVDIIRKKLIERMDSALAHHDADARKLLNALILGDRTGITPSLRNDFNRSGVGHVLAISGLHVGMVAAVSFAVAWWIVTWIPYLSRRGWVKKIAALASLWPVLGYGTLAGLLPSTQRAMLMVSVFLLGIWIGRRHDWLNTLALAALLILLIYPPALLSISFQLSFSAVLAIILGTTFILSGGNRSDATLWKKLGYRVLAFLWVSALAILGTLPIVLHYFNQVSLIGLAANLIVVPLVGFCVVPSGLLAAMATIVLPELGEMCWHLAGWGAQLLLWIVQHAAAWPWAAIRCVTPNGMEVLLYYFLIATCFLWRKRPYGLTAAVAVLAFCAADIGYWTYQRYGRNELRVTVMDVGQASANLIELPRGGVVLVDGGGYGDNAVFDVGAAIIAPLLWHKKIMTVDLMVLSHANSDHLNGLLYILNNFKVKEVWWNHETALTKGCRQWEKLLKERKVRNIAYDKIPKSDVRGGVTLEILAPPIDFIQQKETTPWRDLNNNSLVLRLCYGDVSFLFPGDVMKAAETDLLARIGKVGLQSDVLLVPHHDSRTSSSMGFIRAVQPAEAIISAGWRNRFKFPHARVLERLEIAGSRIWCTADSGAIEIITDGKAYTIATFRPGSP